MTKNGNQERYPRWFYVTGLILVVAAIGIPVIWIVCFSSWGERGQFGDSFAPFVGLLSIFSLLVALASIGIQREELRLQREELSNQRAEMRAQAEALKTSANLSQEANRITSTGPLTSLILQHVEKEMVFALEDHNLYSTICVTPHKTPDRKSELTQALQKARDESNRRLQVLEALVGEFSMQRLRFCRAELEANDDSFIANRELTMPSERAEKAIARYLKSYQQYTSALREFAKRICEGRWIDEK